LMYFTTSWLLAMPAPIEAPAGPLHSQMLPMLTGERLAGPVWGAPPPGAGTAGAAPPVPPLDPGAGAPGVSLGLVAPPAAVRPDGVAAGGDVAPWPAFGVAGVAPP